MRRLSLLLGAVLLVLLIALVFSTQETSVPAYSLLAVPLGQEAQAAKLTQGAIYERNGEFAEAITAYAAALGTDQSSVSNAAAEALNRALIKQADLRLTVKRETLNFLTTVASNGVRVALTGLVVLVIWQMVARLRQRSGYMIASFSDTEGGKLGNMVAASIRDTILQSRQIHRPNYSEMLISSEKLETPTFGVSYEERETLARSLNVIDSVAGAVVNLPIGNAIGILQEWLNVREFVISGNVQRWNGRLQIYAELRKTGAEHPQQVWSVVGSSVSDTAVNDDAQVVEQLAYQILYSISSGLEARNWSSFYAFSQAIKALHLHSSAPDDSALLETSRAYLEHCLECDPSYQMGRFNLGIVYTALGKWDEAREIFGMIKADKGKLQREASYNLGLAFYHKSQDWAYEAALREFLAVLADLDADDHITQPTSERVLLRALTHCGIALVHAQQINRDKANAKAHTQALEENCQCALRLQPESHEVLATTETARGIANKHNGDLEQAAAAFERALQTKPNYPPTYIYLADVYRDQHKPDQALRMLKKAVLLNPHYEYAFYKIGLWYKAADDPASALEAFEKATCIPDGHNEAGKLSAAQGDYATALAHFRAVLSFNSHHSEALGNLAWYLIEAGQTDAASLKEATQAARSAVQWSQNTAYEWHRRDILGWVHYTAKRYDDAEKELRASIKNNGEKIQNRYHLALVLQARNDPKLCEVLHEALNIKEEKNIWRERAVTLLNTVNDSISGQRINQAS